MQTFDLGKEGLRALNSSLHGLKGQTNMTAWEVINPKGAHAIAAGVDEPVDITVRGSTGYYCAGMNKQATIRIKGSAGPGVASSGLRWVSTPIALSARTAACAAAIDAGRPIESGMTIPGNSTKLRTGTTMMASSGSAGSSSVAGSDATRSADGRSDTSLAKGKAAFPSLSFISEPQSRMPCGAPKAGNH